MLREYYETYLRSSKAHAENILRYGPTSPFGYKPPEYPEPLPEQIKRIDFIASHAGGNILDLGSDSGYILHRSGGGVGVDIGLDRIRAARHWYPDLSLVHALAEQLPFKDEVFDTGIYAEILEHVLDPETVLTEAYRVLRPDGKLVVTVPDEIHGKSHENPEHLRRFTEGQLRNLLNRCFEVRDDEYVKGDYAAWCLFCRKGEMLW